MKPRHFFSLTLFLPVVVSLPAQQATPSTPAEIAPAPAPAEASPRLTADQLDQLVGPIALYPDALIALILPAATEPTDLVLAARYLRSGGDGGKIDDQPWDDSVKSLSRYREVVMWMDDNLAWTKQLGAAFLDQPAEVMKSLQHLRALAKAAGTLVDTPQQQVIVEDDNLSIIPTQPDVIYVPRYDPKVVYYHRNQFGYPPASCLFFGLGYPVGLWLNFDLDWRHRQVWIADPRAHRDWRHPVFPDRPGHSSDPYRHTWNPPSRLVPRPGRSEPPRSIVRPPPLPGAPGRPPGWHRDSSDPRNPPPRSDNRDPKFNNPNFPPNATPPVPAPPPSDRSRHPDRGRENPRVPERPERNYPQAAPANQPTPAMSTPAVRTVSPPPAPANYSSGPPVNAPLSDPACAAPEIKNDPRGRAQPQ